MLDFFCLNQKKDTLKEVLAYFKMLNPTWTSVESLVIDKDFSEWAALREVFPGVKVSEQCC